MEQKVAAVRAYPSQLRGFRYDDAILGQSGAASDVRRTRRTDEPGVGQARDDTGIQCMVVVRMRHQYAVQPHDSSLLQPARDQRRFHLTIVTVVPGS